MRSLNAFFCLVLSIALVTGVAYFGAASAAPSDGAVLVSGPFGQQVTTTGETFFDESFTVNYSGSGAVVLSANSDGTGDVSTDDAIDVTVTNGSGTGTFFWDYSSGCTRVTPTPPQDITSLFAAGSNDVRVQMMDECGVDEGTASGYWIAGPGVIPTLGSLTETVGPDTPLWKLSLTAHMTPMPCATALHLQVSVGGHGPVVVALCSAGGTLPSDMTVQYPVFSKSYSLAPGSDLSALASIPELGDSTSTTVHVPDAPVWVAVGDSVSSGHHQPSSEICKTIVATNCGVIPNDASFTWAARAVADLNGERSVPKKWQITLQRHFNSSLVVLRFVPTARSGAATSDFGSPSTKGSQLAEMSAALSQRTGSWNVVSMTGGADDIKFADALSSYYLHHTLSRPWLEKTRDHCPNTDVLYDALKTRNGANTPLASRIIANLNDVVSVARKYSPGSRIVDVEYPYVTDANAACAATVNGATPYRGAKAVVDALDGLHQTVGRGDPMILHVDLRQVFGSAPMQLIQQTTYYGYPHPNATGQARIATAAVGRLP